MERTHRVTPKHANTPRQSQSSLQKFDALLNQLIGDASTPEQQRYWCVKRDFKREIQSLSNVEIECSAERLLQQLVAEAA